MEDMLADIEERELGRLQNVGADGAEGKPLHIGGFNKRQIRIAIGWRVAGESISA